MTLPKESGLLGLDDVKIFEQTADTTSSLTYGSAIDVPGMQNLSLSPNYINKPLMQDEEIDGYYTKLQSIYWSFANAKVDLEVLNILEGGSLATTGTTPNEKHTFTVYDTSVPKYFKMEGQIKYSTDAIGDFHLVLYKCKSLSVQIEYRAKNYVIVSASGIAIPTINNGKIRDYVVNETAAAIS